MKKFRLLTLLALLMTVATGAWAQEVTLLTTILSTGDNASFKSGSQTFDNIATVTFSDPVSNDNDKWGWFCYQERTLTVTAAEGYTITRVKFYTDSGSAFDEDAPFEAILVYNSENSEYITKVNGNSIGKYGVNKIEVYGYAGAPASYSVTMPQDTPDASNWTGKAGTATTFSALPLENVAVGDAVTLKYSGNRRVKTVTATTLQMQSLTVAKGSTELSGDKVLYYLPGDTYRQALARTENQSTGGLGWGYWEDSNITTLFFKEVTTKAWDVAIDGDSNFGPGKGTCNITFDTEIDPTGHTFQFVNSQ